MSTEPHLSPEQRSGATMLPPKAPAPPPLGRFQVISLADFERLPGGGRRPADALAPAADTLARGECVRLPVKPKRIKSTAAALRKLATARSFKVEIRSGPDYVAARNAGAITKGPTS